MFVKVRTGQSATVVTLNAVADTVREPAIEEGLIGGALFGQAEVAFALQRLERAQQHGLAAALAARFEKAVERGQRARRRCARRGRGRDNPCRCG